MKEKKVLGWIVWRRICFIQHQWPWPIDRGKWESSEETNSNVCSDNDEQYRFFSKFKIRSFSFSFCRSKFRYWCFAKAVCWAKTWFNRRIWTFGFHLGSSPFLHSLPSLWSVQFGSTAQSSSRTHEYYRTIFLFCLVNVPDQVWHFLHVFPVGSVHSAISSVSRRAAVSPELIDDNSSLIVDKGRMSARDSLCSEQSRGDPEDKDPKRFPSIIVERTIFDTNFVQFDQLIVRRMCRSFSER